MLSSGDLCELRRPHSLPLRVMYDGATEGAVFAGVAQEAKQRRLFIEQLMAAAVKHEVVDLVEFCAGELEQQLDHGNVEATLALADKLDIPTLQVRSKSRSE